MTLAADTLEWSTLKTSLSPEITAYFCAEFAIDDKLPIYAGGLGVLAGDMLGEAHEEHLPYIGVGMLYRKGHLLQAISKEANMYGEEDVDLKAAGVHLLTENGVPLSISLPLQGRDVHVVCFVKMIGTIPLLLLDTDVEGNSAPDITISDRLYYGDREHRLKQELVLGVGGYRMLQKLGITPKVVHLNEGHSAFLLFELARQRMQAEHRSGAEILEPLHNVVFTNHTLVPAGNDVFSNDLVATYLEAYALEFPIDPNELVQRGLIQDSSLFSPTMLALRMSTVQQAVSTLHAKKAKDVWSDHPLIPVTNGVRVQYWQHENMRTAYKSTSPADLWTAHTANKQELVTYIQETTGVSWSKDDFIIGWARRLAAYKRPLAIFEDLPRLKALIAASPHPVRFVVSGKPHTTDDQALKNLEEILKLVGTMNGTVVYLQNYGLGVAKKLLAGIDILLNTPVRGFEASGTSGMKASLNGVLMCTTKDGWSDEVNWDGMGWELDDAAVANGFYTAFEKEILPLFLDRQQDVPLKWVERMRKTMTLAQDHYSAKRMMDELHEKVYSLLNK